MMTHTTKLAAALLGTALLGLDLAGATAQAANVSSSGGKLLITTANFERTSKAITIPSWTVTDGEFKSFAFCIEPLTEMKTTTGLTGAKFAGFEAPVQRLFSAYYGSLATAAQTTVLGFQLALWELYADNGNLASGRLSFGTVGNGSTDSKAVLSSAATMLATAQDKTVSIAQGHTFAVYTAVGAQPVVTARAIVPVPEPATYAMFGAGLALVGWAARRRR